VTAHALRLPGWWDRFWFAPGSPRNLAAARIVFSLHALWILLSRDYAGIAALPSSFWGGVSEQTQWRFLLLPGHGPLEHALQLATVATLIGAALGLWPRLTCLASALLLYHLAPLETLFWKAGATERGFEVAILALIVLAFAPCADAWSVRRRLPTVSRQPEEYGWPLLLIQIFVVQIYLFGGYAKLFHVGPEWISAHNLRMLLLDFNQVDQDVVFHRLGPWIAARPWASLLTAVGGIALDFGFIAMLFWKGTRKVILPIALLFHAGILLTMNIFFLNLPQLLVFVDWDWLTLRLTRRSPLQTAVPTPPVPPAAIPRSCT
jgi:hypothetical protein